MRLQAAKVNKSSKSWFQLEKCNGRDGRGCRTILCILDTLEVIRKSHKGSAQLIKGIKNYSTLKIVWAILTPPVLIGLRFVLGVRYTYKISRVAYFTPGYSQSL